MVIWIKAVYHRQKTTKKGHHMEKTKTLAKKVSALLLTLSLLLSLAPAALAAEPALPKVGDTVNGFTVKEIRDFPLIGAELILFEHGKTGAKLMYIANDDTNRVFDLTFLTEAIDNTGLPHVFEHSTLDGSEKYPSKSLFFNLIYQTYQTYMNAATYQWMTTYPVGSLSEAQLLKLADYYTDSCLHPMILEDESIYREEAWRYRLPSADAELTIEGTVYSEMLGAMTIGATASNNNLRTAFPGSRAGNVSGGDPAFIPDMTWQSLKDYHDTFYHPSNCLAFLYGKFEDYTAFLKLLDDAFSPYEKQEFVSRADVDYKPITAPQTATFAYPVEAGSDTANGSIIYYTFVCHDLPTQDKLVLNTLTDLLVSDASSMQQSLKKALPSGSFAAYIDSTGPEPAITFVAQNVNKEDAPVFQKTVDAALADVAKNGFPADLVDAVMVQSSISTLLVGEDKSSLGVNVLSSIAYYYSFSEDMWEYPEYVDALGKMEDWNAQGLYAKAVSQYLLNSKTTALTTTYPEPGLKEKNDAAEAERLAAVKASMSAAEIEALVAASNAADEEDDASKYVAQLKAVDVKSLPEEIRTYDVTDKTEGGVRYIDAVAGVDNIGQTTVLLDASGVAQDDLHWLKLFTDLVGEVDTAKYTREELATLSARYLYSGNVYVSLLEENETFHPYLRMSWISLDDDLAPGYELMREMVFNAKVDDAQTVLEKVQSLKAALRSTINGTPYNVQLRRALGIDSELYRYSDYLNYLAYYQFLTEVEQKLADAPAETVANLVRVRDQLANRTNAVVIFAGNETSIALNRAQADKFLASLGSSPITPVTYQLPAAARAEALVVDSNVQFNALVASYEDLGLEGFDGGMGAVTSLVSDTFLYPLLRDQYGAYGVFHGSYGEDGVYIISYRDPNIAETFAVYDSLPELVASMSPDQDTLDGYILSSYVGYAMPSGELSGAISAAFDTLEGLAQDANLTYMKQLKSVTPETFAKYVDLYKKLVEVGVRSTSGPAAKINANEELYTDILDPFGVKDIPAPEFSYADVGEEGWPREEIEFVWENKLMDGVSETEFAPGRTLTKGELSAAVYSMYSLLASGSGEIVAPEEAMEWLLSTGLISGAADDTVTRAELALTLCGFCEAIGMDVTADGDLSAFTDVGELSGAELAAMTWGVSNGLFNGVGDGALAPLAPATRAQAASVLQRLLTVIFS
ncbi:MAG: hypothetical protein E7425_13415 [Ruminococcaceae bacterium]|nr:hypothetical protein [Oscillospiraceae bacterium]